MSSQTQCHQLFEAKNVMLDLPADAVSWILDYIWEKQERNSELRLKRIELVPDYPKQV